MLQLSRVDEENCHATEDPFHLVKEGQEEKHLCHLWVTRVRELRDQNEGEQGYQKVRDVGKFVKKK